jgi:ABC-type Fe3+ transport system permease subunit
VLRLQIAWLAHRSAVRGRRVLETVALLPVSVPGIVFGVGVRSRPGTTAISPCSPGYPSCS